MLSRFWGCFDEVFAGLYMFFRRFVGRFRMMPMCFMSFLKVFRMFAGFFRQIGRRICVKRPGQITRKLDKMPPNKGKAPGVLQAESLLFRVGAGLRGTEALRQLVGSEAGFQNAFGSTANLLTSISLGNLKDFCNFRKPHSG